MTIMHAVDMPAVHPAADAAVNLVPGLQSWANSALRTVSQLDYSKIPLDKNAFLVSVASMLLRLLLSCD